jgi:hypothetical protein
MNRLLSLCAAIVVSACVAGNGRLAGELDHYHARNVRELFVVLGQPSAETAIDGQEVYVWGDSRLAALPQMGGNDQGAGQNATELQCTIRVFVGPDARVISWDVLGNDESCRPYAERLSASP